MQSGSEDIKPLLPVGVYEAMIRRRLLISPPKSTGLVATTDTNNTSETTTTTRTNETPNVSNTNEKSEISSVASRGTSQRNGRLQGSTYQPRQVSHSQTVATNNLPEKRPVAAKGRGGRIQGSNYQPRQVTKPNPTKATTTATTTTSQTTTTTTTKTPKTTTTAKTPTSTQDMYADPDDCCTPSNESHVARASPANPEMVTTGEGLDIFDSHVHIHRIFDCIKKRPNFVCIIPNLENLLPIFVTSLTSDRSTCPELSLIWNVSIYTILVSYIRKANNFATYFQTCAQRDVFLVYILNFTHI